MDKNLLRMTFSTKTPINSFMMNIVDDEKKTQIIYDCASKDFNLGKNYKELVVGY